MSITFPAKRKTEWPWPNDYGYDEESYPNFYSLAARHIQTNALYVFEISDWRDDTDALINWMYWLHQNKCRMLGFNNVGYDYLLMHFIFMNCKAWGSYSGSQKAYMIYQYSTSLFKGENETEDGYRERRYKTSIRPKDVIIPQIDLFKIYHFDNTAKATSLKVLQINMRSKNVRDLPIPPGTRITAEQRSVLLLYNVNDTDETIGFAMFSVDEIRLRETMSAKFGIDMTNFSEGKMGEEIIRLRLNKAGLNTRGKTPRASIALRDVIFPYIRFNHPEFQRVHQFLLGEVITKTKLDKSDDDTEGYPCAVINGFGWQFGRGGMHASVLSSIIKADDYYEIIDIDVISFYPRTSIVNKTYPAHLGPQFCEEYDGVFVMRGQYPKDKFPMENLALKYSLNVPYGKSNSPFSFLYDPQYTMTTTINCQLLICMLGEWLMQIPDISFIQVNTDGITFKVPRVFRGHVESICKAWEQFTCLELEYAFYQAMYIRDVNNYIAHAVNGKIKSKGAYVHKEIPWHKDHSSVIIARAVEGYLLRGEDVVQQIMACRDPFDFMIKAKVPRSSKLMMFNQDGTRTELQNTTRYYVAVSGGRLVKIMPPTPAMREHWNTGTHYIRHRDQDYKVVKPGGKRPAKTYDLVPLNQIAPEPYDREISLGSKWLAADCANVDDFNWSNLNYNYYIEEARKLIDPLLEQ